MALVPIPFRVPVTAVLGSYTTLCSPTTLRITNITGCMSSVTLGTFTVEYRNDDTGELIGSLSWTSPGSQMLNLETPYELGTDTMLRVGVSSCGVGATEAHTTVWALID